MPIRKSDAQRWLPEIIRWCKNHYGEHDVQYLLVAPKMANMLGIADTYAATCPTQTTVYINYRSIHSISNLVMICIHEYQHLKQDMYKYFAYEGDYELNPLEIEARYISQRDYQKALKEIRDEIHLS